MSLFKRQLTKRERLDKTEAEGFSWGFLDAVNLYSRIIADKFTKGKTDTPREKLGGEKVLGDKQFYYSVNRIFTKKGVKKPFFIDLPEYITRGFVTDLRDDVTWAVETYNQTNNLDERVSINCITSADTFKVDLSQGRMRGRFRMWAKEYKKIVNNSRKKSIEDALDSDKNTKSTKHKVNSYLYMKEAVEKEKASFFKSTLILELVASSDEILDIAETVLLSSLYQLEITRKEVFIQTNEYMRSFTPVTNTGDTLLKKMNPGTVLADDTLSSLSVTTHGVVGDPTGVYHGIDILAGRVVTFDMYSGSNARTILVTAQSGEGKSNLMKMLYTFYPADNKYSTVIFDYEGKEYQPLANVIDAYIISLTKNSGKFINTMVIGDLTGDPETDDNLKVDAQEATIRIFNLLVDEYDGMTEEQLAILSDALNQVYLDFGVTSKPETWRYSKEITFFHVYVKIKDFYNKTTHKDMRDLHGEAEIKNFSVILRPYFEEGGLYKHWFAESISIQELLDKKHIVFSFGMGSEEEEMVNEKALALRQLFASHITTLLSNRNKKRNMKTVVVIEEMQRYLRQRFSGEIIAKFASGGRKNGLVTYLVTNAPSELLNMDLNEQSHIRDNVSVILSNINMYMIGALLKKDMNALIDTFNLDNARGMLGQLTEIAENKTDNSGLKYCFYVNYKGQGAILRMLSHPALADLPLYKTIDLKANQTSNSDQREENTLRTVETTSSDVVKQGINQAEDINQQKVHENATFSEYAGQKERLLWNESNRSSLKKTMDKTEDYLNE